MRSRTGSNDYVTRVHSQPGSIDAERWNTLLEWHADGTRVHTLSHGWCRGSRPSSEDGDLFAACALYLEHHSYGEYIVLAG
jgi:predicted N-acyltransferase